MAGKGLTECCRGAMAAKPTDWEIRGLVLGPREADPVIQGKSWLAWAVGRGREGALGFAVASSHFTAEFPELLEAFGAEANEAALMGFDNNGNGIICWTDFPNVAKVYTKFLFHALVIDDAAVGLKDR